MQSTSGSQNCAYMDGELVEPTRDTVHSHSSRMRNRKTLAR